MGFENHEFEAEKGPSWARPNWPLSDTDDLTAALDPTQMQVAVKQAAKAAGKSMAQADVAAAAADSIRAMMLIRTYRVRGHLMADTNPLEYAQRMHPDLDVLSHGLTLWDLDREFKVDGFAGKQHKKLRDVLSVLRDAYCRHVGVEYTHILEPEQQKWLEERIEVRHDKDRKSVV